MMKRLTFYPRIKLPQVQFVALAFVMLLLFSFINTACFSQDTTIVSTLSPRDTLTVIDSASIVPSIPAYGSIEDWVAIHLLKEFNVQRYKSYIYSGLAFRLLYPKDYKNDYLLAAEPHHMPAKSYPLVIFLHGMGEVGKVTENEACLRYVAKAFLDAEEQKQFNSYALIPQSETGFWSSDDLGKIITIIKYMVEKNHVDPMRISVMGLSSGADGAWRLCALQPSLFCSLIDFSAADLRYLNDISKMKSLPVWFVQGANDRKPSPALSQKIATSLSNNGGIDKYSLLKNTGHNTLVPMLVNPALFDYLSSANKLNPVRHGNYLTIDPVFTTCRWYLNGKLIKDENKYLIHVSRPGSYAVQINNHGVWSGLSPMPLTVSK